MQHLKRLPLAAMLLATALAACSGGGGGGSSAPIPTPTPTASLGPSATIDTSGSTNTAASSVVVQTDGSASVSQANNNHSGSISAALASQFFNDLKANVPVSGYPISGTCSKPASFSTTTTITYLGSKSGDVSCPPNNSTTTTIYNDVQQIKGALNVR